MGKNLGLGRKKQNQLLSVNSRFTHKKRFFVYFNFFQAKVSVLLRTAWNHNSCCLFLIVLFQYWRYNLCSFCFTTHALAKTVLAGKLLVSFQVPVFMHLVYALLDIAPFDDFFSPLEVFCCWLVEPIFWRRVKNLPSLSSTHIVHVQELHLFK